MPALALPPVGRSGGGFWDMAQNHMALATNQYEGQRPKQETIMKPPGKTGGGAIGSAAGGAAAGYSVSGNPYGAIIGGAVGLLGYLMS